MNKWTDFTHFFGVSIVDFEQVNAGWEEIKQEPYYPCYISLRNQQETKKTILYIQKYKCKHIFYASQIRAQEFITHRNKNENKKIAIDSCTFSNPNLSLIWQYWALTKNCKTSMKTPMMESLFGQIAGYKLSTWSFILKITTTDIFLGIFRKSSELHLFILF